MVDLLLDGFLSNESVNRHVPRLADPQGSLSGLHIDHRVPIGVEDDHFVGRSQVNAERADSGCQ